MHRIRRAEVHPGPIGIRAERLCGVRDVPAHVHDFFELAVVRGGQGAHVSAGGSQLLTPGAVLLVRPGEWHGYPGTEPLDIDNVYVAADVLRRHLRWFAQGPAAHEVLWPSTLPASPYTIHLGAAGLEESQRWVDALLERQQGAGAATLLGLLLCILAAAVPDLGDDTWDGAGRVPAPVLEAADALEADLARPWSAPELAALVRLSPGHLSRLFTLHLGSPPLEHLARLRAERAASLLIETGLAVSEVGRIVGWADPSYMSRRFRRVHGMSPALYRRTFAQAP